MKPAFSLDQLQLEKDEGRNGVKTEYEEYFHSIELPHCHISQYKDGGALAAKKYCRGDDEHHPGIGYLQIGVAGRTNSTPHSGSIAPGAKYLLQGPEPGKNVVALRAGRVVQDWNSILVAGPHSRCPRELVSTQIMI